MPEIPEPQNPEQPSPAPSMPPEPPASAELPQPPTPPQAGSKLDWRLVVIVGVAVLFLIAIYVNKTWYPKSEAEAPAESASPKESAAPPETQPAAPPISPAERYATMLRMSEMEIQGEMFSEGGRTLLVASPAMPASKKENAKEPDMVIPGTLFDVTKTAAGVRPEMLQRRIIFGGNQPQALFMDTFPPLGVDEGIQMVIQPAADVPVNMIADNQPVVGVKIGEEARAYPVKLMNYHDVINDALGGEKIAVVWSALALAASAMDRDDLTFGSAGLNFQGAIVMYSKDSVTTADGKKVEKYSLWSPTLRECIAGDRAGARLKPVQTELVSWLIWKTLNPKTTVLTGTKPVLPLNYDVNVAAPPDYLNPQNPVLPNPVYGFDAEKNPLFPKARVFGITDSEGKVARAYLVGLLREKTGPFEDTLGDRKLTLHYDPNTLILDAKDAEGKPVLTETTLWIAWLGAHPKTEVWQEARLRALNAGQSAPAAAGTSAPATTAAPASATTSVPAPAATPMPATTSLPAGTAG